MLKSRAQRYRSSSVLWIIALIATLLIGCGPTQVVDDGNPTGDGTQTEGEKPKVKVEALKKFEDAVALYETNPGATDQLIKLLEEAVDEDEQFGEAWYNLGMLYAQKGDIEAAKEAYSEAVASRPDMAEPYVNLARIHIEEGDMEEAKRLLLAVVDEEKGFDPYNVEANLNIGMIYRLEGEAIVDEMMRGTATAVSMEGGEIEVAEVVVPEEAQLKFAESVRHVRKALAGNSNNIVSYENLATVYYNLGALEVATLVCEQAIQKQVDYNKQLADRLAKGQITQEEHDFKMITDEEMASVYNTFGLVWLARGEVSLAYFYFQEAMNKRANFVEAMMNVAGVAVNVQDFQKAYTIYAEVLKLEPENREARLSQAVAARGLGGDEGLAEAEKVYRDLLTEDPNYAPAKFNLGVLYQEYYRDLETAKTIFEEFAAMPAAAEYSTVKVEEAKSRVAQIEEIWAMQAQQKAEQEKIQKEIEEMEKLQQQQNGGGGTEEAPEDSSEAPPSEEGTE